MILRSLPIVATLYIPDRNWRLCLQQRQRLVSSLKLQVSFAEYRLFNRALLQKRDKIPTKSTRYEN